MRLFLGGHVVQENHILLSDDLIHDSAYVLMCLRNLLQHYKKMLPANGLLALRGGSDNCGVQFKQREHWGNTVHGLCKEEGVLVTWDYSAPNHGKGASDAEGANSKGAVAGAIAARTHYFNNAAGVYNFLVTRKGKVPAALAQLMEGHGYDGREVKEHNPNPMMADFWSGVTALGPEMAAQIRAAYSRVEQGEDKGVRMRRYVLVQPDATDHTTRTWATQKGSDDFFSVDCRPADLGSAKPTMWTSMASCTCPQCLEHGSAFDCDARKGRRAAIMAAAVAEKVVEGFDASGKPKKVLLPERWQHFKAALALEGAGPRYLKTLVEEEAEKKQRAEKKAAKAAAAVAQDQEDGDGDGEGDGAAEMEVDDGGQGQGEAMEVEHG